MSNIEEKHCSEVNEVINDLEKKQKNDRDFKFVFSALVSSKLLSLKLLIVPFYQQIATDAIALNVGLDVCFIFDSISYLVNCNLVYKNPTSLTESLAGFICGLFLSPFIMAFAAIDLCVTLSVLCLSLITRIVATIVHMVIYSLSGDNASTHNSKDGLTNG